MRERFSQLIVRNKNLSKPLEEVLRECHFKKYFLDDGACYVLFCKPLSCAMNLQEYLARKHEIYAKIVDR